MTTRARTYIHAPAQGRAGFGQRNRGTIPAFSGSTFPVMPHFQIEGIDINLSLVSQMPKGK